MESVLSRRQWVMDYGEKVISGLMEGEAGDDRERGWREKNIFYWSQKNVARELLQTLGTVMSRYEGILTCIETRRGPTC